MPVRFGIGYDAHTFGADRPLVLGGVSIPHAVGLTGHSDGDAIAHAVIDALLGAAALGDIGRMFPDTEDQWSGADSMELLARALDRLTAGGFRVGNVDITVITERPKIAPHVDQIRARMAVALGITLDQISVKAKTNEGMDAVGAGKGLQVFAVAAVEVA